SMPPRPTRPTLFPYTTLFRSRNKEPVTLPMKFPLLLAQGVEGIAVGLACKILPHNFIELIDASIACLRGEEFDIFPDFPTGGSIDRKSTRLNSSHVKISYAVF